MLSNIKFRLIVLTLPI